MQQDELLRQIRGLRGEVERLHELLGNLGSRVRLLELNSDDANNEFGIFKARLNRVREKLNLRPLSEDD